MEEYHMHKLYNPSNTVIGSNYRWQQVLLQSNCIDFPFRKNSIRFAIKRDPVERFKSAVEMLQTSDKFGDIREFSIFPSGREFKFYTSITTLIDDLEEGKFLEKHLFTQTYFLGDKSNYDYVYDIKDFIKFIKHILAICRIPWRDEDWYIHRNISNNTPKEKLEVLKEQVKSEYIVPMKHYHEPQKHITKFMTDEDIERVKKLYKVDYDNGWC
jgi:hypothetical protein